MMAGAFGEGMLTWLSSWPFDVLTKIRSPYDTGESSPCCAGSDAELLHHVEAPDDVDVGLARGLLVLERAVVVLSRKPSMSTAISSPRFDT